MTVKELVIKEVEMLPQSLIEEVADFIGYLNVKKLKDKADDITLASEKSLAKDWLKPEEDEAWGDL